MSEYDNTISPFHVDCKSCPWVIYSYCKTYHIAMIFELLIEWLLHCRTCFLFSKAAQDYFGFSFVLSWAGSFLYLNNSVFGRKSANKIVISEKWKSKSNHHSIKIRIWNFNRINHNKQLIRSINVTFKEIWQISTKGKIVWSSAHIFTPYLKRITKKSVNVKDWMTVLTMTHQET